MFKSFQQVNEALASTSKTAKAYNLERMLTAGKSIIDQASDLASRYARSYSQIQWMKYDDQGSPSDVTPDSQNSAANAVIEATKGSIDDSLHSFNNLGSITITREVPLVKLLAYARNTNRVKIEFIHENGTLKLKLNSGDVAGSQALFTNWILNSINTNKIVDSNGNELSIKIGRIIEGIATDDQGHIVQWISYKVSDAGDSGIVNVSCAIDGNAYLFQFSDISHTDTIIAPARTVLIPATIDRRITNNTNISSFGIYLMWSSHNNDVPAETSFTMQSNQQPSLYSPLICQAALSGNVTTDVTVEPNDLYDGLDELVQAVKAL